MAYTKHWIPLESNPDVFTQLIYKLGVCPDLAFYDIFSFDSEMLSLVPRPVLAVVLVFPTSSRAYQAKMEDKRDATQLYGSKDEKEDVVWFKQTIHNACGFYGILHAISNGKAREKISTQIKDTRSSSAGILMLLAPNSTMARFLSTCIPLSSAERARTLENSEDIELAYRTAALQGDSEVPASAEDEVDFHYVCYVKSVKNGHLYELDGDREGPVDHGMLDQGEDLLSGDALNFIRSFIAQENDANINFSLLALGPSWVDNECVNTPLNQFDSLTTVF